ncbi:unnamed protein product [Rotaria sp. Silwood2]|nr:unnamed protein product [Rotaria sp. Silwood2]
MAYRHSSGKIPADGSSIASNTSNIPDNPSSILVKTYAVVDNSWSNPSDISSIPGGAWPSDIHCNQYGDNTSSNELAIFIMAVLLVPTFDLLIIIYYKGYIRGECLSFAFTGNITFIGNIIIYALLFHPKTNEFKFFEQLIMKNQYIPPPIPTPGGFYPPPPYPAPSGYCPTPYFPGSGGFCPPPPPPVFPSGPGYHQH